MVSKKSSELCLDLLGFEGDVRVVVLLPADAALFTLFAFPALAVIFRLFALGVFSGVDCR